MIDKQQQFKNLLMKTQLIIIFSITGGAYSLRELFLVINVIYILQFIYFDGSQLLSYSPPQRLLLWFWIIIIFRREPLLDATPNMTVGSF